MQNNATRTTVIFFLPLILSLLGAAPASGQAIVISSDPSSSGSCNIAAPVGGVGTGYILFFPLGNMVITGAEFQVRGVPAGEYITIVTANPPAIFIGDPFAGGCNIAFPECQTDQPVLLYTVHAINVSDDTGNVPLEVTAHSNPPNPGFICPLVTLCDAPVFTKVCVNGSDAALNGATETVVTNTWPLNGATDVVRDTDLLWHSTDALGCLCAMHSPDFYLYFGTHSDPPLFQVNNFDVGILEPLTTYYWRVAAIAHCGGSGPEWSFTTGESVTPPLAVERMSWEEVKRLFR